MKVVILAAGMGTRLGNYTKNLPKAMLHFNGKPIIEWQIGQLKKAGFRDISIITGYKKDVFKFKGVKYYHNKRYRNTNMLESLMCAKEELESDVLIAYADIIYTPTLLNKIMEFKGEIGVAADMNWREYWKLRYGTTEFDIESFKVINNQIIEIGRTLHSSEGIDCRYIGLIKFSKIGIQKALDIYSKKESENSNWKLSNKIFRQGYMTDLLNELIIKGNILNPIKCNGGWMEFDTSEDYEIMLKNLNLGLIKKDFFY